MKAWISELKRRRVFQTFALYVVGAWVVIQVAQAAFEAWDIPMQVLRYLWVGLALVSPLAILFAWRYDITADGIVRTPPAASADTFDLSLQRSDYLILSALVFVLATVGWGLYQQAGTDEDLWRAIRDSERPAIAVLPFTDLTPMGDLGYFGNGVADALLNELGHITELDVIARTSSFHFQGSETSLAEIAASLAVDYLVEGSINLEDGTVHVVAKLIEAATGKQLWSGNFEASAERPFTAQQDIAGKVAGYLELSIGDPRRHGGTTDFEAYESFLRAGEQDDPESTYLFLDKALAHDPEFARALVGKAWVQWSSMWGTGKSPQDAWTSARPLLEKALSISEELGMAHALLGAFQVIMEDYPAAQASLERALAINPSNTFALLSLSKYYLQNDRQEDGIALARRLVRLDPMTPGRHAALGARLAVTGDIEGAIESYEQAIELRPECCWFDYALLVGAKRGDLFRFRLMERLQREVRGPDEPVTLWPPHVRLLGQFFMNIDKERAKRLLDLSLAQKESVWTRMDLAGIALDEGDFEAARQNAWIAVEGMPRNEIPVNIAATVALLTGEEQRRVLAHYREYWPGLFDNPPDLGTLEPLSVVMAGQLLRESGDEAGAVTLFAAGLERGGPESKAAALVFASQGDNDRSLDALEAAIAGGATWVPTLLKHYLRDDPRLDEVLQPLEETRANTRAEVEAMIASGAIILPTAEHLD